MSERDRTKDILLVIDMQNDFISGELAAPEGESIIDEVVKKINTFDGEIIFTQDTHDARYDEMNEGKHLPIEHCIKGTWGWQLHEKIAPLTRGHMVLEKPTFGSPELGAILAGKDMTTPVRTVTLVGLVTDICVLSNAIIAKANLPQSEIYVDAKATAGTTAEAKRTALKALAGVHVVIVNEDV
ncbi:MAG TPA: cysteine hydrolase [Fastidiosipila sp.]|jgi:nicotinamidase/pyrazinamidase|nr:cysteine hydrolase [Fastidiosipila sp.]